MHSLRVDLSDGSVLAVDRVAAETQTGKMSLRAIATGPETQSASMDIGNLAAVIPDPSRLVALGFDPDRGGSGPRMGGLGPRRRGCSPMRARR